MGVWGKAVAFESPCTAQPRFGTLAYNRAPTLNPSDARRVMVANQFAFKDSSRKRPLKLSTWPFCIGRPGWM